MNELAQLGGALAAGLLAWGAIAAVALADQQRLRTGPLRVFGALAILALALAIVGVPVPWVTPLVLLGIGVALALIPRRTRTGEA